MRRTSHLANAMRTLIAGPLRGSKNVVIKQGLAEQQMSQLRMRAQAPFHVTGGGLRRTHRVVFRFFGGKSAFETWAKRFEAAAARNDWSDEEMLDRFPELFSDRLCDFPADQKGTWVQVYRAMCSFYPKAQKTIETWRMEFRRAKQSERQSVLDFGAQIERIASHAYPGQDAANREVEKCGQFQRGLKSAKIRDLLVANPYKTFEELKKNAVRIDGVLAGSKSNTAAPVYISGLEVYPAGVPAGGQGHRAQAAFWPNDPQVASIEAEVWEIEQRAMPVANGPDGLERMEAQIERLQKIIEQMAN